ncbi:MAG: peptidylprolyl isomerase [Sedimentisphaerales bacterium]|nr:peptidylprolyl isomerase [Sedimentisphaerales bacterium]
MIVHKRPYVVLCGVLLAAAVGSAAVQDANDFLKTELDRVSYIIGRQIGNELKSQGIDNVNADLLARGLRDFLDGRSGPLTPQQQQEIIMAWQKKRKEQTEAEQAKRDQESIKELGDKGWKLKLTQPPMMAFDPNTEHFWILDTNKGEIRIKLMPAVAPMHVTSTIFLTNKGFYDGTMFHRVIPGFMAQGGCPLGTGRGGPGYAYAGEIKPNVKHDRPYLLSMANTGQPNTDGSQFFITFKPTPWLDGKHTIFGEVVAGQDTVKKLEAAGTAQGEPKEELKINKARIEEKAKP